jgi:hypothetical protein
LSWLFLVQAVVFYILYPAALAYFGYVFRMATIQYSSMNLVFPFTYASAIGLFAFTFLRMRTLVSIPKALLLAAPFPFAATSLFEQTYQTIGYFVANFSRSSVSFLSVGVNVTSVLMIFSSITYWKPQKRMFSLASILFIAGFALWAIVGYPQIYGSNSLTALAFNIPLKILAFMLLALLFPFSKEVIPSNVNRMEAIRNRHPDQ